METAEAQKIIIEGLEKKKEVPFRLDIFRSGGKGVCLLTDFGRKEGGNGHRHTEHDEPDGHVFINDVRKKGRLRQVFGDGRLQPVRRAVYRAATSRRPPEHRDVCRARPLFRSRLSRV